MIKSFRHKGLRQFFETGTVAGIQPHHAGKLRLQLFALNRAQKALDLNVSAWKLHSLTGHNPAGQDVQAHWSLSVSSNWRLTFAFKEMNAVMVDYQDYH